MSDKSDTLDRFAEFWALYPRKANKGASRKAFTAATKKVDADVIIESLRRQLAWFDAQVREHGDFRPLASSWLNGERWDDDIQAKEEPRSQWDRATYVGGDL